MVTALDLINSPRGNCSIMDQVVACDESLQDDMGLILASSHVFSFGSRMVVWNLEMIKFMLSFNSDLSLVERRNRAVLPLGFEPWSLRSKVHCSTI